MRVEAAFARPGDDLAGDRRRHRRVDEQATEPVGAGRRHLADQRALVADDRRIELEHAREMHRARDHPAGHQADDHASGPRRANRGPGVRSDLEVVADERPVDVERDQPDGQDRFGRLDPGHVLMMPESGLRRFRLGPVEPGDPGHARQPRQVELDGARPAGQPRADERHDRLALVGPDLEHRDAVIGHGVREQVEQPPDHLEPVDAAVQRQHGLERGRHGQARHRVVPDVRQVGEDDVEAPSLAAAGRPRRTRSGPRPRARPRSRGRAPARRARCRRPGSRRPRAP